MLPSDPITAGAGYPPPQLWGGFLEKQSRIVSEHVPGKVGAVVRGDGSAAGCPGPMLRVAPGLCPALPAAGVASPMGRRGPTLPTTILLLGSSSLGAPPRLSVLPFLQVYCLAPFDLIKVRLQNQTEPRARPGSPPPRYRGPVHCAVSICQEEGPRGLFRGAWALMLRDTPTLGIYFVTYEWLCRQSTPEGQSPSKWTA